LNNLKPRIIRYNILVIIVFRVKQNERGKWWDEEIEICGMVKILTLYSVFKNPDLVMLGKW
jgi:hypothetical protein